MATCPDGHQSAATDFCDVCGLEIGGGAASKAGTEASPDHGADQLCPRCGEPRAGARFCEGCSYDFVAAPPVPKPFPRAEAAAESPAESVPAQSVSGQSVRAQSGSAQSVSGQSGPAQAGLAQPGLAQPDVTQRDAAQRDAAQRDVAQRDVAQPDAAQSVPAQSVSAPSGSASSGPAQSDTAQSGEWTVTVSADRAYYDVVRSETAGDPEAPEVSFPTYCPDRVFVLQGDQVRIGRRSRSQGVTPEIDLSGPPADPGISHLHALLVAQPDRTWAVVDPGSTNGTTINDDLEPIAVDTAIGLRDGDRVHVGAWTTITVSAPVS